MPGTKVATGGTQQGRWAVDARCHLEGQAVRPEYGVRSDYADTEHPRTTAMREDRIVGVLGDWPWHLSGADHRETDFSIYVVRGASTEFVRVVADELSGRGRHRVAGVR